MAIPQKSTKESYQDIFKDFKMYTTVSQIASQFPEGTLGAC